MPEIIKAGELEWYEFYCSICGTRFRARVDECESVSYTLGIPFVNIHCPLCLIHNCSRRADDYIKDGDEEEKE